MHTDVVYVVVVGCRHLGEGVLNPQVQQSVVVVERTPPLGAEHDIGAGDVGEDLVGANRVERGEPGVEADCDLHRVSSACPPTEMLAVAIGCGAHSTPEGAM